MAKIEAKADWHNVDIDSLPKAIRDEYDTYKQSYAAMKAAREAFETAMCTALASATPTGKRIVFGYNFGKLSLAIVDAESPKASAKAISLDELCKR